MSKYTHEQEVEIVKDAMMLTAAELRELLTVCILL